MYKHPEDNRCRAWGKCLCIKICIPLSLFFFCPLKPAVILPDPMKLMSSIVECYNDYTGKDGDASSLTMNEMLDLYMKELLPWMQASVLWLLYLSPAQHTGRTLAYCACVLWCTQREEDGCSWAHAQWPLLPVSSSLMLKTKLQVMTPNNWSCVLPVCMFAKTFFFFIYRVSVTRQKGTRS